MSKHSYNPAWKERINKYIAETEQVLGELKLKQENLNKSGPVIETQRGKIAVEPVEDSKDTFRFRK